MEDPYKREYFEAINKVKGDLEKRFTQQNFLFVRSVEALLIDSASGKLPEKMVKMYEREGDMQKLKLQLQLLQDAIKMSLDGIRIREFTWIQFICCSKFYITFYIRQQQLLQKHGRESYI